MQKKQKIQFAVLLIFILALAGTYTGVRAYNRQQEETKEKEQEEAVITLTSFAPEDVTSISYDTGGTSCQFEKEQEEWKAAGHKKLELDQDAFESFLKSAGSITAETEVEAEENADYGFKNPSRTVTITTTNGTSSLIFGDKNTMLDQYYVKTSESSRIYLVTESVYTMFEKTPEEFKAEEAGTDTDENADSDKHTDTDADSDKENGSESDPE